MTEEQLIKLREPFKAEDIEWVLSVTMNDGNGPKGLAVPYVDARAIQDRLDTVFGAQNWKTSSVVNPAGSPTPTVFICTIDIYDEERKIWISKSDGAGCSESDYKKDNNSNIIKGGISNAFKRTASVWGIGRYLYDIHGVWINTEIKNNGKHRMPQSARSYLDQTYNERLAAYRAGKPIPTQATPRSISSTSKKQAPRPNYEYMVSQFNSQKMYAVLMNANGTKIGAYTQNALIQGQLLVGVQLVQKSDPKFGEYYILKNYRVINSEQQQAA